MKTRNIRFSILMWCILVLLLSAGNLLSQMVKISRADIHSEGNFYVDNGILYVDAVVVKFKDRVIDLPQGVRYAIKSDVSPNFPAVTAIINSSEEKIGSVSLIKQIPTAQWGDVIRRHKITGKLVTIQDLSQLFTFRFSKPVPLDSTLSEFLKLPEVEYAHEPVSIVYYDSPDDPKFQDGSQWNLDVIQVIGAWNITQGNSTIKIGIVDEGTLQNHEDLQGKIAGGDAVEGEHGTWVAGVAGAETNNSKGVASLGWNISLNTYGEGGLEIGSESFIAENISEAANNSHIINMSFGTLRYVTRFEIEDLFPDCPRPDKWDSTVTSKNYQEIETAVSNAIAQGVICVAAAGNASKNQSCCPDPEIP